MRMTRMTTLTSLQSVMLPMLAMAIRSSGILVSKTGRFCRCAMSFFLLSHAFMKDVGDEERVGIHESNLNFYYNKYYKKTLNPKYYGKDTNAGLIDFVKDTVVIEAEKSVLSSQLADDCDSLDIFVKLTEESRRERQRRIDAGDETARLQFSVLMTQQNLPKAAAKVQGGAPMMREAPWGKGKGAYMAAKGGYGGKW
mmetsp:Transcript_102712/g.177382  ORF Transcript_102712/g.177382 Transcript_102712/m.177382 type:complete len:197 (+) Transcript_102712:1722-2312(+)